MVISNLPVMLAERHLTISKVYDDTGISRTALTSLAKGRASGIRFDTLNTLCRYLGATPDQLLLFVPIDVTYAGVHILEEDSIVFASDTAVSYRETEIFDVCEGWVGADAGVPNGKGVWLDAAIVAIFDPSTHVLRADVTFTLSPVGGVETYQKHIANLPRAVLSQIEHDFALSHAAISDPLRKIREAGKPQKGDVIPAGVDPMDWLKEKSKLKVSYNVTWPVLPE